MTHPVNSPTFTLVNIHPGAPTLYHVDLYRLHDPEEAATLGLDEFLFGDGITAIEWAERAADWLPPGTVHIHLAPGPRPDERLIVVRTPAAPESP